MTESQRIWARARDGLVQAVTELGFSAAMAEVIARELKIPKAIDRMTSWVRLARPRSEEMLADEMLAIRAEIDAWREKKPHWRPSPPMTPCGIWVSSAAMKTTMNDRLRPFPAAVRLGCR